jgi:hypothetical protein
MKQAQWLLFAAALALVPSTALAQKKSTKGGGTTTTAPTGGASGGGGAAGGQTIDLDQPQQPQPDQTQPQPQPQAGGTGGGICEIDPSACPKQADIGEAAKKEYKKEIYAVEQIYVLRYHRVELTPYWGFTLNDQFVSHTGPGLNANFYITNVFAVGLNGNFYSGSEQRLGLQLPDAPRDPRRRAAHRVLVERRAELHVRPRLRKVRRVR